MESIDDLVERWTSWLTDDGPIAGTILRLQQDRERWRRLREMVASNPTIPDVDDTLGWFWYHYACDAAIRIRRLADTADNSASLGRLLDEVATNASLLTRAWYLDQWRLRVSDDDSWELFHRANASEWFDRFAGAGVPHLPTETAAHDAGRLEATVAPVKLFVDKRLAHHNPKYDPTLSYDQISTAIDTIGDLFNKYVRFVRQVDPLPLTDLTAWGEAFTVAWCPTGVVPR